MKEDIVTAAEQARENAYSPYSGFKVGAAVEASTGRIFVGANVENASFGVTICAERAAVSAAVSAGERELVRIAIVTDTQEPAMPCGACRQVLAEFNPSIDIIAATLGGKRQQFGLNELFPRANQGLIRTDV